MSPLVAGMRPAKSCKDASSNETIVYSPAKSEGQMAVCSVPPDTIHPLHIDTCKMLLASSDFPVVTNSRS